MKKSSIILLILGILVILLLAFLTDRYFQKTSEKVFSANGTIEYISLEGGFYGIVTDEGEKYLPLNLPEEFKKDGLRVWFKAKPKKVTTNQMWGKPIEILEIKLREVQNLSQIKVAVQYRYVTDGKVINRSLNKVIKILKETKADLIFQGWMTQEPCPDKCSVYLSLQKRKKCNLSGYSYEHLKEAISRIKKELPDIIFCGGTQAEYLYPEEAGRSYLILEPQDRDKAWEMALNPEKWGIEVSKKDFQCYWAKRWGDIDENEPCPSEEELKQRMRKYFPDLTNPNFQKILLERIYKQIDAGVDAIWIDMLYAQGRLMTELTKDPNHPAVKESYKAAFEVVEKIHEYGKRKGKYIYVITWVAIKDKDSIISVPKEYVNVDAAMVSPSPDEIKDKFTGEVGKFNEKLWDELVMKIKEDYRIPIFARIDYGGPGRTQLYVFSQELSKEEARDFLRKADEFFSKKGIIFIYPVHGGDMGRKDIVKKFSYGKFNWYDSLASEFETYETIKDLAQSKYRDEYNLKKYALNKLKNVKVVVWYQYLTGGRVIGRSDEEAIKILKGLNADLVRGWWRWQPLPFSPDDKQFEKVFGKEKLEKLVLYGQTWQDYENIVKLFKKEMPDAIFMASFGLQFIPRAKDRDPITGEIITRDKAWKMAFDPQKHGFRMSKAEYQCIEAKKRHWVRKDINCKKVSEEFVKNNLPVYWGDPTNEDWQNLAFHIAQKLIDGGADAIWIDMYLKPSANAVALYCLEEQGTIEKCDFSKALENERVKEIINAQKEFIDRIREYGFSKGKYVLVGSWGVLGDVELPQQGFLIKNLVPKYDFVVTTISQEEIYKRKIDTQRWENIVKKHREIFGDIPMFVWFDTGYYYSPMHIFSQYLNKTEQAEFLEKADKFFINLSKKENLTIVFVYPISGQMMGPWKEGERKVLSFECCCNTCKDRCLISGEKDECGFGSYDALAPEFETYETIKDLAHKKKVEPEPVFPEWINEPLFEMIQLSKKGTLTFKEQEKMLPLLAEMGIKTIYLTPIWEMCENPGELRRYCIKDYYKIDPAKGTEEDLKEFVEKAHSYGMKVILDLVTAHTSPGRYIYENHKDWILKDKYGRLVLCWPHKHWGYAVDRKNPKVIEYFTRIAKYYVDKFGIDGWRVDAIGTMYCNESIPTCPQPVKGEHHSKDLLKSIKSALGKDKALYLEWCYLGRLYLFEAGVEEKGGCPYPNPIPCSLALPELNEYADASYSYEFGKCFMKKILAGKITSQDFVEFFKKECLYYGKPRGRFLMTHDFGYQFYEKNPELHKLGAVLITTIPGFPHIYHREIFPEGDISPINQEMFNFYKKLLKIRERHKALKYGSISNVWKSGDNVIAYLREYEDEKVIVMVNFLDRKAISYLDLSFLPKGSVLYDELNDETFNVSEPSNFKISIPKYGSRILILKINRSRNAKT
ncbi:MAG: hypothetical protein B5M53_03620 [Candidatus Cloacimonas sp. 4484_209]|nr:MAG: hypothetical protein B5M53_03620 [Candidatus Cloacimonas sp. 4484_209]